MKTETLRPRLNREQALDEGLAAWLGWFSVEPLPAAFASLVDQLEAGYRPAPVAARVGA